MTRHDAERKQKIIECIARTVAERGYPPSVREIADAVGLASTSAVHHHLTALEREGLLQRGSHASRALRLTPRGEAVLSTAARQEKASSRVTPFRMPVERDVLSLPVLGEIAAGQPIEAAGRGADDPSGEFHGFRRTVARRCQGHSRRRFEFDLGRAVVGLPNEAAAQGVDLGDRFGRLLLRIGARDEQPGRFQSGP